MDRRSFLSFFAISLSGVLAGCATSGAQDEQGSDGLTAEHADEPEVTEAPVEVPGERPFSAVAHLDSLSETQRNSLNVMNYLVVLVQRVNASKNNRLLLDDVYHGLYNNILPDVVDQETLGQINYLAETIEGFRMTDVKRQRLRMIYERAQADAARQAIPDPIALLSAASSGSLAQFAISVVYMAVDSASSYSAVIDDAEAELIEGNWELDDKDSELLHRSREGLFTYIVTMVEEYGIPGFMSMTEEAAEQFAEWEQRGVSQRIRYFEKECNQYCALGAYWLLLAQAYYEDADYERCIKAIETYESFSTGIFRNDVNYAKALTLGISAAELSDQYDFAEYAKRWVPSILENCSDSDWALRFFAAQSYLSIAGATEDNSFVSLAYETALDNVNELIPTQRKLNEAYIAPIEKEEGAENFFWSDEKAKDKYRYNKLLEEERKTALSPLHQPLISNLELVYAIQQTYPEHADSATLVTLLGEEPFLSKPLNERYCSDDKAGLDFSGIEYDCNEIKIPASYLVSGSKLAATVSHDSYEAAGEDWQIDRVERGDESDPATYIAIYKSNYAESVEYVDGANVSLEIKVLPEIGMEPIIVDYRAVATKEKPWEHLAVWDDGFGFERQ
mgnify:FL=1